MEVGSLLVNEATGPEKTRPSVVETVGWVAEGLSPATVAVAPGENAIAPRRPWVWPSIPAVK